ncbi:Iron-sulfur cluster assembly 2 [Phytophthora nicotianae]|uniref:Iron-sulfur cluster assembly 2 n=1 Tax=Phytophthora nicotianae TaxID=4792 RepID=A0A0W8C5Y6_PHYNI|nr:Iron-sulfur cluster assembly 2 [Phytophthora nicotianae]
MMMNMRSMLSRPLQRVLRTQQPRWISNFQKLIEAAERQKTENLMLRVAVEGGGCSGFQYVIEFEKDATPDAEEDVVFEQHGGKVVVDKESLELIRGSTLDYEQELIRSAFAVVNNPNAVSGCGCGTSFDLKD